MDTLQRESILTLKLLPAPIQGIQPYPRDPTSAEEHLLIILEWMPHVPTDFKV